jgi:actin related protein 2/3 complex subunit 5
MSIIREHTQATLSDAWRTINIDALDPDSSVNFDISTLHPPLPEISEADVRQLATQVRQLLRGGDAEGALRGCLEAPVYNTEGMASELALQTVIEVLQSIKASDMTPMLKRIFGAAGGSECLDVLMKYLCVGILPAFFALVWCVRLANVQCVWGIGTRAWPLPRRRLAAARRAHLLA